MAKDDTGEQQDTYHLLSLATYYERMHGTRRVDKTDAVQTSEESMPPPSNVDELTDDVNKRNTRPVNIRHYIRRYHKTCK